MKKHIQEVNIDFVLLGDTLNFCKLYFKEPAFPIILVIPVTKRGCLKNLGNDPLSDKVFSHFLKNAQLQGPKSFL